LRPLRPYALDARDVVDDTSLLRTTLARAPCVPTHRARAPCIPTQRARAPCVPTQRATATASGRGVSGHRASGRSCQGTTPPDAAVRAPLLRTQLSGHHSSGRSCHGTTPPDAAVTAPYVRTQSVKANRIRTTRAMATIRRQQSDRGIRTRQESH